MTPERRGSPLPPHLSAAVRSVDLARAVTEVLGRVPRLVGGGEVEHQAVPLVVVEGTALDVATVGPWTATVDVYDRKVKVAAVRASAARTLAASHDRKAAVHLNREAPAGCVWALYLDGTRGPQRAWEVAVLCLRPAHLTTGGTR